MVLTIFISPWVIVAILAWLLIGSIMANINRATGWECLGMILLGPLVLIFGLFALFAEALTF